MQNQATTNGEKRLLEMMERLWNKTAGQIPADEFDLTMSQLRLIDYVGRHVGCHLQDIADGLQLSPPTVSVAVRKLEEAGWFERRPDPDDGRASCVFLTSRSEEAVRLAAIHRQKFNQVFFSGLSIQEQETLLELLEKGVSSVEKHLLDSIQINQEK